MASPSCSTPESLAESKAAHTASLAIHAAFPVLAFVVVALRVWSRSLMKTFGWDDGLICFAMCLSIAQSGVAWKFTEVSYGGYHTCDIPPFTPDDVKTLQSWLLIQQLLYNPILGFVKASVLLFLLRFRDNRWYIKRSLQILFALNIALAVAIFLADLLQCTPISYMYDFIMMDITARLKAGVDPLTGLRPDGTLVTGGTCIAQTPFVISSAAIVTATEALTLAIPMAMVCTLKIARRKKIAVITILSLGWLVVAISIARLVIFARLLAPSSAATDAGYGAQNQISTIEVNLAIVVACAPALKALTKRLAPRFLSSRSAYGSGYRYGAGYGKPASGLSGRRHSRNVAGPLGRSATAPGVPARHAPRGSRVYFGKDKEVGVSVLERSESREEIMDARGGMGMGMGIEKTVQIDIEMDDLEEGMRGGSVDGRGMGREVRVSGAAGAGSSRASSKEWRHL